MATRLYAVLMVEQIEGDRFGDSQETSEGDGWLYPECWLVIGWKDSRYVEEDDDDYGSQVPMLLREGDVKAWPLDVLLNIGYGNEREVYCDGIFSVETNDVDTSNGCEYYESIDAYQDLLSNLSITNEQEYIEGNHSYELCEDCGVPFNCDEYDCECPESKKMTREQMDKQGERQRTRQKERAAEIAAELRKPLDPEDAA